MSKQNRPQRYRKHAHTISYSYDQESRKRNGLPMETVEEWDERTENEVLANLDDCIYIASSPVHRLDKRYYDDGSEELVEPHKHRVIHSREGLSKKQIMSMFNVSREANIKPIKDVQIERESLRYLVHATDKALGDKKHLYDASSVRVYWAADQEPKEYQDMIVGTIKSGNDEYKQKAKDAHLSVLLKVCAGEWTAADAREYYATDPDKLGFDYSTWQSQKRKVLDAVDDYLDNERKFYIDEQNPRCLVHTYIEGEGGSGKDTVSDFLAGHYADHRGIHKVGANGKKKTFDPAGQYEGQNVSVFTEVSGKSFSINEFCSIFDPIRANSVNSRNNDKYWFARYAFMSNSIPLERFIWDLYEEEAREHLHKDGKDLNNNKDWKEHLESDQNFADKIRQIRRRFAVWVRIEEGTAYFYRRNNAVNTPTCHLDYLSYGKEYLWQNNSAYSVCDRYKADHKSCKQCEHFVPNKQGSGSCSKLLPWEWVYVGECNIKDEQSIIELHEQAVRDYFEQDPDYFTVTPWNTPTWRDVQKVSDMAKSDNNTN